MQAIEILKVQHIANKFQFNTERLSDLEHPNSSQLLEQSQHAYMTIKGPRSEGYEAASSNSPPIEVPKTSDHPR